MGMSEPPACLTVRSIVVMSTVC